VAEQQVQTEELRQDLLSGPLSILPPLLISDFLANDKNGIYPRGWGGGQL